MRAIAVRARAIGLAAFLVLGLAACMVTPGRFTAALDLRRDGSFAYTYDGEIYLLALSRLAEMGAKAKGLEEFTPSPCFNDEGDFEERECTAVELARQKQDWEDGAAERTAKATREADQMKRLMGGIDPADPKAAEELAARLRSQEGWKRVEYKGDGLFEVSFAISSRLGHDFLFPTFERFPLPGAWVTASRRQDGRVRIDAPGFAPQSGADPFSAMGGLASLAAFGAAAEAEESGKPAPVVPEMEGTFRIVTDGQVLSNNTDEGPQAGTAGQVLEWKINRRTAAAPMALIALR